MKLARLHVTARSEPFWHVQLAMIVAICLQLLLNPDLTLTSKYYTAGAELLLLLALSIRSTREGRGLRHFRRNAAFILILIVSVANLTSLGLVVFNLFHSSAIDGRQLLLSGLAIYLTNIIIFGLWYWELDTPDNSQAKAAPLSADFLFPQMSNPHRSWRPTFFDYLYISITNATAFSPTDTLPLTHRVKLLMSLQSLVSLITIALVAARAVNILG